MKTHFYEFIYLVRQDVSQTQAKALAEQFTDILKTRGGTVSKVEHCGLLNTAYPVRKNRKAHYVLLNIEAPAEAMDELVRQIKLNEDVIRHLSVRVEELNAAPSALAQTKFYQERFDQRTQQKRDEGATPEKEEEKVEENTNV